MLTKVCLLLILYFNILNSFSRAQYHYLGVKNVNQVEPPSLESSGIVFGSYADEPPPRPVSRKIKMRRLTQARKPGLRSMQINNGIIAEAPSKTGGWRVVSRSLADKKCASAPKTRAIAPPQTRVLAQAPKVRMVDRKKVETPLKVVSRVHLAPQNAEEEEKDLKPNIREKIETYTEVYVETTLKTRVKTRKRLFVQQRKIVNQRINKPVMIVRRKMIQEKQVFERIIPKIIETRQIVNHPSVQSRVIEGPVVEMTRAPKIIPAVRRFQVRTTSDCPVIEVVDDSDGETVDGDALVSYSFV